MARRGPVCLICSGLVLVSFGLVCLDQFRSGLLLSGLVCPARFGFVWSHVVCSTLLGSDLPGPIWFAVVWSGLVWSLVIDLVCLVWFAWSPLNRSDCSVQFSSGLACFTFVCSKLIWSGLFCFVLFWFRMV